MSLMRRLSAIFKAKANQALDNAEDPRQTLDYSYERLLEMLQQVRRGVADVATSRKRLELQGQQLEQSRDKLEAQARDAIGQGREDLAREALARRAQIGAQLVDLKTQHDQLVTQEQHLIQASERLQAKVDAFQTHKETISATYTAAAAQARISETVSGISEEMGDVGLAVRRAEDKTAQMQARSLALDELIDSGALDNPALPGGNHLDNELHRLSAATEVDEEMKRLTSAAGQPRLDTTAPAKRLSGPDEAPK